MEGRGFGVLDKVDDVMVVDCSTGFDPSLVGNARERVDILLI